MPLACVPILHRWEEDGRHWLLIRRSLTDRQEKTYSFVFGPSGTTLPQMVTAIGARWSIENRLHWRRDVTLREDDCQVRKGEAPRVLAVLDSFLLALLDFLGVSHVPSQMRTFDAHPLQAVRLLLGSLLAFK